MRKKEDAVHNLLFFFLFYNFYVACDYLSFFDLFFLITRPTTMLVEIPKFWISTLRWTQGLMQQIRSPAPISFSGACPISFLFTEQ